MLALTLISLLTGPLPNAPFISPRMLPGSALGTPLNPVTRRSDSADEAAEYIAGLYEGELFEMVVKEAQSFLSEHAKHQARPLVRYRLASALFELERSKEAIPHYQRLAGQAGFEYRAEAQLRLGQCELLNERPREAREVLRAALASDQDYLKPSAAFFLGEAEFRLKNYPQAREQYEASLSGEAAASYHAHARRGLAWSYFLENNWSASQKHSSRFLSDHGDHELAAEVRFLLGDAAFQAENYDAAENAWSPIEQGAWLDGALRGRAWIRSKRGDNRAAAIFFARLLEANGRGRFAQEAALQCGVHLLRAGNKADALRVLQLPAVGQSAEATYWQARALRENEQSTAALALIDKHKTNADPDWSTRLQTLRADILFDLGRLEEAAQSYQEDGSEYGLHAGATASLNGGQPEHALQLANQFLEQFPKSTYLRSTQLVRAEAYFALQDYSRALADLSELAKARDLSSTQSSNVLSRLAWCQYLLGDVQTSARSFARVPADCAEAQEAKYMVGRAHSEAGDVASAIENWQSFLDRYPNSERRPEVQLSLSRLTGDPDLLRQLLREAPGHEVAAEALLELAGHAAQMGQAQQAIKLYREYLQRFPRSPLADHGRYSLCWELRAAGELQQAEQELQPLLASKADVELQRAALELGIWLATEQQNPQSAQSLWNRFFPGCKDEDKLLELGRLVAQSWTQAQDPKRSQTQLAALAKLLKTPSRSLDLLLDRAWLELDNGTPQTSAPLVQQAIQLAPRDPRVLELCFFAAEQRYAAKDFGPAAGLYTLALDPANAGLLDKALYKLGFTFLALEQPEQAAQSFERLVAEHGTSELHSESLYLAGEARFRLGQMAAAYELLVQFQKNVRRHAARPKALHRLGLVANSLGEFKTANEALTELLTSAPEFAQGAEARYQQGIALLGLQRIRAARASFRALLEETQNSDTDGLFTARARIELGRLDLDSKDYENALSHFLKVSLLFADGEEVREAKWLSARVLEAQGETRLAVKNYRELEASAPASTQGQAASKRLQELGD